VSEVGLKTPNTSQYYLKKCLERHDNKYGKCREQSTHITLDYALILYKWFAILQQQLLKIHHLLTPRITNEDFAALWHS
jgi:hypothetical protein